MLLPVERNAERTAKVLPSSSLVLSRLSPICKIIVRSSCSHNSELHSYASFLDSKMFNKHSGGRISSSLKYQTHQYASYGNAFTGILCTLFMTELAAQTSSHRGLHPTFLLVFLLRSASHSHYTSLLKNASISSLPSEGTRRTQRFPPTRR